MIIVNTKFIIQHIIHGRSNEKVCSICFIKQNELKDIGKEFFIDSNGRLSTLSSILRYITNYELTLNGTIDSKICQKCVESAIKSYIFVKQCQSSVKAIERCVDYMTKYVDKIDYEKIEHGVERENLLVILPDEIIDDSLKSASEDTISSNSKKTPLYDEKECYEPDIIEMKAKIIPEIKEELHNKICCAQIDQKHDVSICDYCGSLFGTKSELVLHIKRVHNMFDLRQSVDFFENKTIKLEHTEDVKNLSKLYNCSMCAETFTNLSLLKEHKNKHPEGTMHICRDCGRMYKTVMALRQHYFVHKIKTKNYLCQVCGKAFLKKSMLNAHAKSHDEKIHQCPYCHIRCQTENKVTYHIRQVHEKEYNHMCDVCGKLFASSGELGIHKDRHVIKNCALCGKGYKDQKQYKFHMRKHETATVKYKEKKYECDYCGCSWKYKWCLVQHIYGKHLHNRPYKCAICQKGFYTKSAQSRHNIVHTKERPEVCTICQKRFVDKRALLFHTRIHTGEKPYECSECGIKFLNASRRLAHIKSKHLEPREECHICHKKFAWRKTLKKHLEKHNEKDENNDVYSNQFYLTYLEP